MFMFRGLRLNKSWYELAEIFMVNDWSFNQPVFFLLWFHELLVLLFNYSQFRPPEVEIQIPKLKKISKKNYSLFFIFKPVWSLYKPMSSQSDISYSKVLFHKLLSCCIKNQQHRPKAVVFNLFSPCTLHVGAAYFSKVLKTK